MYPHTSQTQLFDFHLCEMTQSSESTFTVDYVPVLEDNYAYILTDIDTQECMAIDPAG